MIHAMITMWFHWVQDWGYAGVFILMAMESTVLPVPSELIMPPAAFWAAQGQMNFWGVVFAGTAGSYFGSVISYIICFKWGRPVLSRIGRYFFLTEDKIIATEAYFAKYGAFGVFLTRLMPVIRHLISMVCGLFKMKFSTFSFVTLTGAALWCYVLSLWGQKIIGAHPELLNSPEEMIHAIKSEMLGFAAALVAFAVLYVFVVVLQKRLRTEKSSQRV